MPYSAGGCASLDGVAGDALGRFDAYAVRSRSGPHVTLQAGAVHQGRHWTTVSRRSVKARAVGRSGWASATATAGTRRRLLAGRASVLDGLRPWTALADPVAAALAGGAVLRIGASHPDQLLGYAEGLTAVPAAFAPWGRSLLVVQADDELLIEGGRVIRARGRWNRPGGVPEPDRAHHRDRPPTTVRRPGDMVPAEASRLIECDGPCWLGLEDGRGAVAVPARWDAGSATLTVSAEIVAALRADLPGPACVTVDDSRERRPDRKRGVMLRGRAAVVDGDGTRLQVVVEPERVTIWDGFRSRTVAVPPAA